MLAVFFSNSLEAHLAYAPTCRLLAHLAYMLYV